MSDDLIVGSVAVDVVPDARSFRRKLDADLQGLRADVGLNADTEGVREQIATATRTKPVDVKVALNDTDAKAQLAKLQADLRSKSLNLTASTADARAQISALRAEIATAKTALKINADDAEAKAKLAALTASVRDLRGKLEVDTAPARSEIDALRAEIARKKVALNVNANTAAAEAQIDAVARDRSVKLDTREATQGLGLLATAAITLGPALVPLTAAVAGLGAALAAPVATAAGGLGIFGIITGAAVKQTEEQKKQIQALAQKVQAARTALANTNASANASAANTAASAQRSASASIASAQRSAALSLASAKQSEQTSIASAQRSLATATTAAGRAAALQRIQAAKASFQARQAAIEQSLSNSRASAQTSLANSQASAAASANTQRAAAQRALNDALQKYHAAIQELTPAQKKFLDAQDNLKTAFKGLIDTAGPAILGPLTKGMVTLKRVLPDVAPLVNDVSRGIGVLFGDIAKATRGPGFKAFIDAFGQKSLEAIVQFGRITENFGKGLMGVFGAFTPLATGFMRSLSGMSRDFADFGKTAGQNEGLRSFVDYVQQIGPKVVATLGSVVGAIANIVRALAPIGGVALAAIKGFADVIRSIPTPVLTTVAAGAVALAGGLKAIALAKAGITGLQTLGTTLAGFGRGGELTRAQSLVRGFAGAGGLGLLTSAAGESNGALKTLSNIGGGAMLGFSLGGPIGGAIGAGAGALLSLWENTKKSTQGFKDSIPTLDDYASSLDSITGAATAQTKADTLESLRKSGALDIGKRLGLSARTQVNAALGNVKAQHRVNLALQKQGDIIDGLYRKFQHGAPGDNAFNFSKVKQAQDDYKTLAGAIGENAKQFRKAQNAQRDLRQATFDYAKLVKDGMPKAVVTKLKLDGFPTTTQQVAELAAKYKGLSEHDIKTLIKLGNVPTTLQDVARVTSALRAIKPEYRSTLKLALNDPDNVSRFLKTGSAGVGKAELSLAARANGGPVVAGQSYLVGERGPEIFSPSQSGRIIPNGGGGVSVNIEQMMPHDYNDFARQLQDRSRTAGLGSRRPAGVR